MKGARRNGQSLTICHYHSRQLGSGGAYLGQRLAFRLNALYLDHQIVFEAAKELKIPEEDVVVRDEKVYFPLHHHIKFNHGFLLQGF